MSGWAQSLIRLSTYEVETLQKRVREIEDRRATVKLAIVTLDREAEDEAENARLNAEAGWYLIGFRDGWRARRAKLLAELSALEMEVEGARDALSAAFEAQKKYEHVAEVAKVAARKGEAKREGAALDELALRRAG